MGSHAVRVAAFGWGVVAAIAAFSGPALGWSGGSCWVPSEVAVPKENEDYQSRLRKISHDQALGSVSGEEAESQREVARQAHQEQLRHIEDVNRLPPRDVPMCPSAAPQAAPVRPAAGNPTPASLYPAGLLRPEEGDHPGDPAVKYPTDIFHASEVTYPGKPSKSAKPSAEPTIPPDEINSDE